MKKHPSLFFLIIFALFSIYAIAGADPMINVHNYPLEYCFKQIQWYLISGLGIYCISQFSNRDLYRLSWPIYLFFLIAVWLLAIQHQLSVHGYDQQIIPFSQSVNGSTAWYYFPGIGSIQPSEFLKMAHLLLLSHLVMIHRQKYPVSQLQSDLKLLFKAALITLPAALGILGQNDTGVMMILLFATVMLLFVSGIRLIWFIGGGVAVTGILAFLISQIVSQTALPLDVNTVSYRIGRILGWLNPEAYYHTYGYQLFNAKISMSTAELFGHGFQAVVLAFPEPQTDFIFAVLVSNAGYFFGMLLIGFLLAFDLYLLKLAKQTAGSIHSLVLVGLIGSLFFQQFWNIAMVLGILPITGITLPFISYGGSSLLSYMLMMGLVFNLESELAEKPVEYLEKPSVHV